jgi:hypothetical protein
MVPSSLRRSVLLGCLGAIACTGGEGAERPPIGRAPASADGGAEVPAGPSPDGAIDGPDDAGPLEAGATPCPVCTEWMPAERLGRIADGDLEALSGLAASWRNPGVLYVHNDREYPVLFAVAEGSVAVLAQLTLDGASVRDVEDVAVGRCAEGSCIYLADLGNNFNPRTEFALYRTPEPRIDPGQPRQELDLPAVRLAFRYEDAPHNAESLLIDPGSGDFYVVTKEAAGQPSAVYRLQTLDADRINLASQVAVLTVPRAGDLPATAASAHPCGAGFLLRTGNTLYEFRVPAGTPLRQAFSVIPVPVPVGEEIQGEAVSYRHDGRAYYTTSEGDMPPVHRVSCQQR